MPKSIFHDRPNRKIVRHNGWWITFDVDRTSTARRWLRYYLPGLMIALTVVLLGAGSLVLLAMSTRGPGQ